MILPIELHKVILLLLDFYSWCNARFVCHIWRKIILREDDSHLLTFAKYQYSYGLHEWILPNGVKHGISDYTYPTEFLLQQLCTPTINKYIYLWTSTIYVKNEIIAQRYYEYQDRYSTCRVERVFSWCIFVHNTIKKHGHVYIFNIGHGANYIRINCNYDYSIKSICVISRFGFCGREKIKNKIFYKKLII